MTIVYNDTQDRHVQGKLPLGGQGICNFLRLKEEYKISLWPHLHTQSLRASAYGASASREPKSMGSQPREFQPNDVLWVVG